MAYMNWFDANDPANAGDGFPAQPQPSGDVFGGPTFDPSASAQNTGITGAGFTSGTPTPTVTPTAGTLSPGSMDWILDQLKRVNSTDDPNYWLRVIAADPKVAAGDQSAIAYWVDRIRRGDGSELVRNGTLQKFADGGGAGGFGFGAGVEPFKPFTLGDFMQDPGYQFALKQGQDAIQKSAAARGTLLTGGTQKALQNYTTGLASQQYGDFFNRSLADYNTNRDTFYANQDKPFDKWFRTAGLGANAAAR